jgi:hypothetical protein
MSKGYTQAPWRPIPGTGQTLALNNGSDAGFTNAVGAQTRAVWLSMEPAATASGCLVTISQAGTAATVNGDMFLKTTDPGLVIACSPGDKIHAWGLAASLKLHLTELTC